MIPPDKLRALPAPTRSVYVCVQMSEDGSYRIWGDDKVYPPRPVIRLPHIQEPADDSH